MSGSRSRGHRRATPRSTRPIGDDGAREPRRARHGPSARCERGRGRGQPVRLLEAGHGSTSCCSTVPTTSSRAGSSASTRASTGPATTGTPWCRASGRVSCTRFAAHGPWAPEHGQRFDPTRVLLDPYGRGVVRARRLPPRPAGDGRRPGPMKSVVVDPSLLRLGGRPADRPAVPRDGRLRGAPARVDGRPGLRRGRRRRGTYAGFIEKIPYLVDLGITAVELLPVFQFDRSPRRRADQLLGLPAGLVLRAACAATPAGPARPRPWTSSGPGQGSAPRRPRGHPRRRLQPHGGGRRGRPDVLVPRASPTTTTTCSTRTTGALRRLQRHRQHAQRERPDRPPDDPRQPALLGRGDARRRLPVRPRLGPVARRGRRAADRPADPAGTSRPTRSWPGPSSSPRPGTPAACTRSGASSATAGSSGTGVSATTSAPSSRATRDGVGAWWTGCSAAPTSTATSTATPRRASTS